MKVFYDHQALTMQRFGGISRYYHELIRELNKIGDIETGVSCFLSQNEYFKDFPGVVTVGSSYHWRLVQFVDAINRPISSVKMRNGKCDIIHPTYYDPYFLQTKGGKKVITIHDMIQEVFPEYYANDGIIEKKKANIYGADHIIAISENTKKDILRIYPDISPEKITVVYHGTTKLNTKGQKSTIMELLPKEYILFVGNRFTYKNFKGFFEAMKPIIEDANIHIVCAGGGRFSIVEQDLVSRYESRIHQYSMSDADLAEAYKNAICFVFPSLYEGFGLPVLEAFQCGCPVVMSNTSSLPEVGGDAAEYFDPKDMESMTRAIRKAIDNVEENHSEESQNKRSEQIERFTWQKSAMKMKDCYEKLL